MSFPYPDDPPPPSSTQLPATTPPQMPYAPQYTPRYPPDLPPAWARATPVLNYQINDRVERGVNQLPLLSMIAGIATIPFLCSSPVTDSWPVLSAALGIVAVALGHVALARAPRVGVSRGNGLAITGLVLGYLTIAIAIVWVLLRLHFTGTQGTPSTTL